MTDLSTLSQAELIALISKQQAQLAAQASSKITLKVGEKGTLCLYHGARYPIALYAEQWERLLPFFKTGEIEQFIERNRAVLARRDA